MGSYSTGGAVPCPKVMVWAPEVPPRPHPFSGHGQQFDIRFSSYYQVPIDVTAGTVACPVDTKSPFVQSITGAMQGRSAAIISTT